MSQTSQLLDALKKCLRAKGLAYRDVARELGISEASVKRIFSQETFSLDRLEAVCRILDMSIYDLARMTRMYSEEEATVLTVAQEKALADDSTLLTYFYLLLIGHKPDGIATEYGLDELTQVRILTRLDRLKLIDLYPKNRVRLLVSRRIVWRPDGPIRRQYEKHVKAQFVDYRFTIICWDYNRYPDITFHVILQDRYSLICYAMRAHLKTDLLDIFAISLVLDLKSFLFSSMDLNIRRLLTNHNFSLVDDRINLFLDKGKEWLVQICPVLFF